MKDEQTRYKHYMPDYCTLGAKTGPQTIVVRQVLGEKEKQKVLDIHVCVPERKPAIEQIVDVFVKKIEVNCVDVITDKVIVRGEFEIKAIYVACLPGNPVHAVEIKHFKWTQDIDMLGARRGMDAEASVICEFVDYDVAEMTRAYKYKYHGNYDHCDTNTECSCEKDTCDTKDSCDCAAECPPMHPMPPFKPPCKPDIPACDNPCSPVKPCPMPCPPPCPPPKPPRPPKPPQPICPPCPPYSCEEVCCRDFDVSVVLKITAKVLTDREVQMHAPAQPQPNVTSGASAAVLPEQPKG